MVTHMNALRLLKSHLKTLVKLVKESPEVRRNHGFMRKLANICNQLPIISEKEFGEEAFDEYSDSSLVSHLSTMTKGFDQLNDLVEHFNTAFEKHAHNLRMFDF